MSRNLRRRPRINYYEIEEPNLDEYIYCDACGDYVYEYCAIHGPLLVLPDDKVPSPTGFPSFVPRAALTIPQEFLHLAPSTIPGAGLGVFASLTLPKGVRLGPYCGQRTQHATSEYSWQIYDGSNRRPVYVVDAGDPQRSNWMRYVNCSRHFAEQNLVAYQYQGELYYRTVKVVPRMCELLVFYGAEYARTLRVDLRLYNKPAGYAQLFGPPPLSESELKNSETSDKHQIVERAAARESPSTELPSSSNLTSNYKSEKTSINSQTKDNKRSKTYKNSTKKCDNADNTIKKELEKSKESALNLEFTAKKDSCNTTKTARSIKPHLEKRAAESSFICDLCSYKATEKSMLIRHLTIHTSGKEDVSKSSYSNTNVRSYSDMKHYTCEICNKKFTQKCNLTSHIRIHTGEKPFACEVCDKKFTLSHHLTSHIRIHTGEKPFACEVCDKKFTLSHHLTNHIRIHTGEKPFACEVCDKKFALSQDLTRHIRIHTGEKPFACEICDKKFRQYSILTDHIRIHTGEKPFACEVCDKKFIRSRHLTDHIRIHTGEKPFACEVCDKKFRQNSALNKHIRTHTSAN